MNIKAQLEAIVVKALEDLKAQNMTRLDVRSLTTITDVMLICTGTSEQHIRSIGEHVLQMVKNAGFKQDYPQNLQAGDWVLLDLGNIVVHIMKQSARDYYALEKLWDIDSNLIAESRTASARH